ncbi:hypothetical protein [Glaciecola sp. HTCC2999]|uniref:hypothetical protein n=1 Tax=Glaciecola sp. HTCC2999 TaxID=455436 RepID=UPI0000E0FF0B|nr:hypothetical protein [Glaciecola sp. HTCC2999]
MEPYDYLELKSRNSVLELTLSLSEVFDYLGLGALNSYEIKLVERVNNDNMPIRIMGVDEEIVQGRLIASLELHTEKNVLFSKTTTHTRNNIYKVLTVIDDTKNIIIDVSANNILITNEQMYATRDEITEYYRNDLLRDNPSEDRNKQITKVKSKRKKEPIQDKRFRLFETFCKKVAKKKNLPDDKHKTVYDSYQPPMTRKDFYDVIAEIDKGSFRAGCEDFFRDKRIEFKISTAARNRK